MDVVAGSETGSAPELEVPDSETPESASGSSPDAEGEATATETDSATAEAKPTVDDEPDGWKRLKAKFPGKTDAELKKLAPEEYFQAKKALKQFARENEQLKAKVAELEGRPRQSDTKPETPAPPPDLAEFDQRISALTNEAQTYRGTLDKFNGEHSDLTKRIATLQAKAEGATDWEKDAIEARIETAQMKLDRVEKDRDDFLRQARRVIDYLKHGAAQDRARLARDSEERARQESAAKADKERIQREFPAEVDAWIDQCADDLKVPADPAVRAEFEETVYEHVMVALFRQGKRILADNVDVPGLIRAKAERFMKSRGPAKVTPAPTPPAVVRRVTTTPQAAGAPRKTTPPPTPITDPRDDPKVIAAREKLARLHAGAR